MSRDRETDPEAYEQLEIEESRPASSVASSGRDREAPAHRRRGLSPERSSLSAFAGAALLALWAFAGVVEAESPTPVAMRPAAQASLLAQLHAEAGDMRSVIDQATAAGRADHLSLGDPIPVWDFARRVRLGTSGVRLEPYLETTSQYLVPVSLDRETVGLVRAYRRHDEGWTLVRAYGAACARRIESLEPRDRVFDAETGARLAMLVARGEEVLGIEECSTDPIPPAANLSAYDAYVESGSRRMLGLQRAVGLLILGLLVLAGGAGVLILATRRGARKSP